MVKQISSLGMYYFPVSLQCRTMNRAPLFPSKLAAWLFRTELSTKTIFNGKELWVQISQRFLEFCEF